MRLPKSAHASAPWRIHEITRDFRLEDVWALLTPGGPADFPRLVRQVARIDVADTPSRPARQLFALRARLGRLLGWEEHESEDALAGMTLRDRLPADLRDRPPGPGFESMPFRPVFLTDDEWAAEIGNRTVHAVLHLAWVRDGSDGYRGQMAVLVKPNGLLGRSYMAAIGPFRHWIVYPALLRGIGRGWRRSP